MPYANEPAITKHLAQFLAENAESDASDNTSPMAHPDAILFNGGFFTPSLTRERIVEAISRWFQPTHPGWQPHVLNRAMENPSPETAVAIGAAYYGNIRRTGGLRIGGGSARAYYIGLQTNADAADHEVSAICVMPRGTEEGATLDLPDRVFKVLTNRPVSFTLYSATSRHDTHGSVITFNPDEVRQHAPLITILRYGKRSRQVELDVQLKMHLTEVGTLELWCESQTTEHRWRLQFQLRGSKARESIDASADDNTQALVSETSLQEAECLIRAVFGQSANPSKGESVTPEDLIGKLETALGVGRDAWPLPVIRNLCDLLLEVADGRKKNKQFEARWLNLFGFCLRPGFSAALDEWRIEQSRKIYFAGLAYPNHLDCQIQWFILWRRIVGGMTTGQQKELYQRHLALVGLGGKKRPKKQNRQIELEGWRLLASLERLPAPERVALGNALIEKIQQHPTNKSYLWSLGRLGARVPFAGPINCVVPAAVVSEWLDVLLTLPTLTLDIAEIIVQLGARTDDPVRDISDEMRQTILEALATAGTSDRLLQRLRDYTPPARADAARLFGESLPEGLRLAGG